MRFSANLGFLWSDLPLPDGIRAAAAAGFDAVECHWPYDEDPAAIRAALRDTGMPMLGLNTRRGGDDRFGLSALPDHVTEARAAIDEALEYAAAIGAGSVHVMAGLGDGAAADTCFRDNLQYACDLADPLGITILIEPLNAIDAPGYFLRDTVQAVTLIEDSGLPNLRLMFDCYHVGRTEGDVLGRLRATRPFIGHVQIASVPDRVAPDHGAVDYPAVFDTLRRLDWRRPVGAEYRPEGRVEDGLGWMALARREP